jgi:protein-tyrosine phosphatase
MPALGLGAEHYFDDMFWELFVNDEAMPYPGGHAALVEFSTDSFPLRVDDFFFEMQIKGVRPVIAHPERYRPLFRKSELLEPLVVGGALPLLDLMSLVGKYGRRPKRAAERLLAEGFYYAACSDCHRPSDVEHVEAAIARLKKLVGPEHASELLSDRPLRILEGNFDA